MKFIGRCWTWAISIITIAFMFVPESTFKCIKLFSKASDDVNVIVNRLLVLVVTLLVTIIVLLIYRHFRQKVHIKGKNFSIEIIYGDILEINNCKKVIPFDECFSTTIGDAPHEVKADSICGQYLIKCPIQDIQGLIERANLKPSKTKSKFQGRDRYDHGKLIPNGEYLLMAFTSLDKDGLARMSREEYLDCLDTLWKEIDKYYAQSDVCIPILGSGRTRLEGGELNQQEVLDIIIQSYKLSCHKIKHPRKLRIICKKCNDFTLEKVGSTL